MPHKILLFGPPGDFYETMLKELSQAFVELGHESGWQAEFPTHDAVASFAKQNGVSLVFEINRTLGSEQPWPSSVSHAAWLQDHWVDWTPVTNLGKSDHVYFLYHPDASYGEDIPPDRRWSVLSPGARADAPAPETTAETYDIAFCGHLPSPVDKGVFVTAKDGTPVPLRMFIAGWPPELLLQSHFCLRDIREHIQRRCDELGCDTTWGQRLAIDTTLVRTLERQAILNAALSVSNNVGIWGPDKWLKWPEFAPFYKGDLPQSALDKDVYQASRLNVHTGVVTMHVRSMDCMAVGGFLMINRTWIDDKPGGINHFFATGEHYASYDKDNFAEVARRYLGDPTSRTRIAAEGRRAVLAAHTWKHRAQQILRDFS